MQFAPEKIDDAFYDRLREHYSESEIVELGAFIGFNVGYHTFFGTLDFYPMFSPDGELLSQDESKALYGDTPGSLLRPEVQSALARRAQAAPRRADAPSTVSDAVNEEGA